MSHVQAFHSYAILFLLTNLVIAFVHWVSTGVLHEPRQCSLFWDYIPLMWSNQKQRRGSEFAKWYDIYTPEECADEWRQNNADLKLLENCVMYGFIPMVGIMFMTATGLKNSPHSFDVYTVSRSRSEVTSAENPAPENQSIGELRNGHVVNLR